MVLVFEFLGTNLYKYMRTFGNNGLHKDLVKTIAIQVLNSLAFLKKAGVIHCDLKPENILFTNDRCDNVKVSLIKIMFHR